MDDMDKKSELSDTISRKILMKPRDASEQGVFNPGAFYDSKNNKLYLFPRVENAEGISTIGYAEGHFQDNEIVIDYWKKEPIMHNKGFHSLEDPRVTQIDGSFYLTCTAYDGRNARVALAESNDLKNWVYKGIISPDSVDSKNVILFPEKVNKSFCSIFRFIPDMYLFSFKSLENLDSSAFWTPRLKKLEKHVLLRAGTEPWMNYRVGAGAPPIKTGKGWLLVHHGAEVKEKIVYCAGAVLLDLENPGKILGRTKKPLIKPGEKWETSRENKKVVFPTAAIVKDENLHFIYGAGDWCVGHAFMPLEEVIRKCEPVYT